MGKLNYTFVFILLLALWMYQAMPKHSYGTFWNPLNVTLDPLENNVERYRQYMDDFTSGRLKLVPLGEPKVINGIEEVKLKHIRTGWVDDRQESGVNYYDMTPELYEKLCPPWDHLDEQLKKQTEYTIAMHKTGKWGPFPIGAGLLENVKMNGSFADIPATGSLYFNSQFEAANELAATMEKWEAMYVSSFYSNFPNRRLTSPLHNAMVPSIAITCSGSKWWIFSRPRATAKYGARAFEGASFLRGQDEEEENFIVNTGPGSIISFPPFWNHWVLTNEGKSFMYTLRNRYDGNPVLNYMKRLLVERMSLLNQTPGWYKMGSALEYIKSKLFGDKDGFGGANVSSYELTETMKDVNGVDNRITKEELDKLFETVESVQPKHPASPFHH